MLDYLALGRLPAFIEFSRNNRPTSAHRTELGTLIVHDHNIWIADAGFIDIVPPLPVVAPRGSWLVYAYQWAHRSGGIDVCVVIAFSAQRPSSTRQLIIETDCPDLTDGITVDTAEIAIRSENTLTLTSGLGDGYYPILANYCAQDTIQSLIVDFKVWEPRNYMLLPGQKMDEYGIVLPAREGEDNADIPKSVGENAGKDDALARYHRDRLSRNLNDPRHHQGPPCPHCGKPLRTAKAKQCFSCGANWHSL